MNEAINSALVQVFTVDMLFYDAIIKIKHFGHCRPLECNVMWAPHHDKWETGGMAPCIPKLAARGV
jgi:hypothetical protein